MHSLLFYIILTLTVSCFLFERWLNHLNLKALSEEVPPAMCGIYPAGAYARSQQYTRARTKVSNIENSVVFALTVVMLLCNGFARIDSWACGVSANEVVRSLLFFGAIDLALHLISLPFDIHRTFVTEAGFGFNRTSPRTFTADLFKGLLLEGMFGGLLLGVLAWLYGHTTGMFWIWALGFITLFSLLMTLCFTPLILPLFNKMQPLEDGALKEAIMERIKQTGYSIRSILIMDGSKRSSKGNAFFSGLGRHRSIVLYDTLVQELTVPQTVAVLTHEIGHDCHKHIRNRFLASTCLNAALLFLLSRCLAEPAFAQALQVASSSFHIGLLCFGLLYSPVSFVTGMCMNVLSRRDEYQADAFAAAYDKGGQNLSDALCRLSVKSLTNLTPHPYYVFFNHSHPTLLQRIKRLEKQFPDRTEGHTAGASDSAPDPTSQHTNRR